MRALTRVPRWGTPDDMAISTQLKRWREKEGLTQGGAAEKIGVPKPTYRKWEYGEREPRGLARTTLLSLLAPKDPKRRAG